MAGNGFVFVRLFDRFATILQVRQVPFLTLGIIVAPLLGIGAAYFALCEDAESKFSKIFESISLFILTVIMAIVVWQIAGELGLIKT